MHHDRNNGSWSELKSKRQNKFDDEPFSNLDVSETRLDIDQHHVRNIKKDLAAKQFARLKKMFKNTANYDIKEDTGS